MNSLADGQIAEEGFLKGEITKLSDDRAEIILDDGQEFFWPTKDLPKDFQGWRKIKIVLTADENKEDGEDLAKKILNQLLENNDRR